MQHGRQSPRAKPRFTGCQYGAPGVPGGLRGVCVLICCRGGAWWIEGFREVRGPGRLAVWPVRPCCGKRGGTACGLPFRGRGGPLWRAPRRAWRVRRPCRIRALAGLPGRVTPMYLRTAFVYPGAPYVLHGCRESWLRGSDSSPGARTWETGWAASPGNGGAICAARHAAWHGQQQPNHGDIAKSRQPAASYPRIKSPLLAYFRKLESQECYDMRSCTATAPGKVTWIPVLSARTVAPSKHGASTKSYRSRPLSRKWTK